MREMGAQPFIGSEALAAGLISWHELGKYYTAIMPNVYLDKRLKPSLRQRVIGLAVVGPQRGDRRRFGISAARREMGR